MAKTALFKYEDDDGGIHPIRLSAAMAAAGGQEGPSGDINRDNSAEVSSSRRSLGLHPRYVTASRTIGTAPNDFKRFQRFYVLTKAAFGVTPFLKGETFTYETFTWTVTSVENEKAN